MAGALLSPLGLGTACAGQRDPCKAFCRCRNKSHQDACLAACRECGSDASRLCGTCGSYVCCAEPGPFEYGACVDGRCSYWCAPGAADCGDGACTPLWADPNNCGACGNVCPDWAQYCDQGACREPLCAPGRTLCGDHCVNLFTDYFNCGACGNVCFGFDYCAAGVCQSDFHPSE